jgi:hypothetical protein
MNKYKFEFNNYSDMIMDIHALGRGSIMPESNRSYNQDYPKRRFKKAYWKYTEAKICNCKVDKT